MFFFGSRSSYDNSITIVKLVRNKIYVKQNLQNNLCDNCNTYKKMIFLIPVPHMTTIIFGQKINIYEARFTFIL